jgi:hypothetical protein
MLARRARVWRVACRSLVLAGFQCFSLLGSNQAFHLLVSLLMKLTNLLMLLLRRKRRTVVAQCLHFRPCLLAAHTMRAVITYTTTNTARITSTNFTSRD